jgi:predicted O-methyltransferase YrrM
MNDVIQQIYDTGEVVGRSGNIHKLHSAIDPAEGEFLSSIIREDTGIASTLEIGCAYGLSSLHICMATQGRAGVSHTMIDPFQNTQWDGVGVINLEKAGIEYFELVEQKSEFALPRLLDEKESQFDLIFVDGWHTFDHTLVDCFYANRLLRVGGYLVIDDVSLQSVRRVANYFSNYPCYEKFDAVGYKVKKTWKNSLVRLLSMPLPRRFWARILNPVVFHNVFADQNVTMVALRKLSQDDRNWDWHVDCF